MPVKNLLDKTFGGLDNAYYLRQFLFGLIFPAILIAIPEISTVKSPLMFWGMLFVNTALYPYSRFVYESVISQIFGANAIFATTGIFIFVKSITMLLCWALAVFIAPVGLLYLYFYHSKKEKQFDFLDE